MGRRDAGADGRRQVRRLPRHVAAHDLSDRALRRGGFEDGFGFDGSSIRGWQRIYASRHADDAGAETAIIDPFPRTPTLSLICDVVDPITASRTRATRAGSRSAPRSYLESTGIADTAYFGPEAEFFIFDAVAYDLEPNRAALRGRLRRGPLEHRHSPGSATRCAPKEATSRRRRTTRCTTCAPRWC